MNEIKLSVFFILSAFITYISWNSLKTLKSHGFYRFFAFELIIFLTLLNIEYWYDNPFSSNQIISWTFLLISFVVVIDGFYLLKKVGKPTGKDKNTENLGFENTSNLVTSGIYKFIRHPLYASLLFLGWGISLKNLTKEGIIIAIMISIFITLTAIIEEKENRIRFGDEYSNYMLKTKMFIPFIF